MILHSLVVEQAVDLDDKGYFAKQIVVARGPAPIAMVRKRAAIVPAGAELGDLDADAVASPTRGVVLLVHGYGQNRYAFHLPSRSFCNHLARAGFDVYNVDLRGRGRSGHLGAARASGPEDFILEDLPTALAEIRRLSGDTPVYLVGHSLGGVVSYATAVEQGDRIGGVVTLGSPYHFTRGSLLLAGVAEAFLMLDRAVEIPNVALPLRAYGSVVRAGQRLFDSRLYPVPIRGFRRGSMEADVLRQHMALAMDHASVSTMRAMFSWASELRRNRDDAPDGLFGYAHGFESLDVPLLVVSGQYDDLAPPASVRPGYERSRSTDKTYRELPFGHIDLLVGRKAPVLVWPLVEAWLRQRMEGGGESRDGTVAA